MITKSVFNNKFFKENPNVPSAFVNFYIYENKDGIKIAYALICNGKGAEAVLSKAEIEKLIEFTKQSGNAINAFCEMFSNKPNLVELAGNFILETGQLNPKVEDLISYVSKERIEENPKNGQNLFSDNNICAYKVLEDGSLCEAISFSMQFKIETIKKAKGENEKRCWVENSESFERGKGLYREALTKMLPKICAENKISGIVLNASAFDTNSSEKGGQEKLENFYKNNGFTKVEEKYLNEFPLVKSSDFDDNMPVYYKSIENEFSLNEFAY